MSSVPAYPEAPEPLPVGVYDNHTHLEFDPGYPGLELGDHLDRASAVGVLGVVQVGTDLESSRWSAATAAAEPRVLASVAIHPNEAVEYAEQGVLDAALAEIDALAALPRVVSIGETGLDYYRTETDAGRAAQLRSFEAHIAIAKKHELALQIHDRDAHDDVIATLLRVGAPERTVFHCYSGDAEMAAVCAAHGWYLSFAGNVTFKNAGNLREALAVTPRSRILVETDAPFLTPVPLRGRPNAPYLMPHTVRAMATYLDMAVDDLGEQLATNTEAVYGRWS
ncbi:TatD family deoxyribonuclease [Glaciibacter flavus]|uniref:TatD family deoxyribonuclease n=1 Tax=Orlajensenia flava TaxID=2565934 RepID=A0A4S4G178_9MICO|nr:TatD family hydrolase [Glaciibacter flavus]THG36165.1 TatD family deoxyribonuclease [Glaciibacter flavus]